MFPLRNKEPKAVLLPKDLHDWEPSVMYPTEFEMDALGARLDSARSALGHTKPNTLARTYWTNTVNSLTRQWRRLMVEANIGVHRNLLPETWMVRKDWFEVPAEIDIPSISIPWLDERRGRAEVQEGLERSWAQAQEERFRKALTGFV